MIDVHGLGESTCARRRDFARVAPRRARPLLTWTKLMISMVTYKEMGMKLQYKMKKVIHMPHAG